MELEFVNRKRELAELERHARDGGLLVAYGRRRVGKTRLLSHWLKRHRGLYTQAIEASKEQQVAQVYEDLRAHLGTTLVPRSFGEVLELLDLGAQDVVLCVDEFPYLVASDPTLPSVVQRWLDHRRRKGSSLVLTGSSTRMMNDLFLNRSAPLFGRTRRFLDVAPMSYAAFCAACRLNPVANDSFARFSLVGGVPHYWELMRRGHSPVDVAEDLFFGPSPVLEFEPSRLLADEGVSGMNAPAALEAIGRGAHKPSEIAARLGTAQTNLSRIFQILLDARLVSRQLPFGESVRSTKRSLYAIADPTLRFWYSVYSPHRSRWHTYSAAQKRKFVDDHASTVFEDCIRARWPDAQRYWEGDVELDVVRLEGKGLVVGEVKWKALTKVERASLRSALEASFARTTLAKKFSASRFEVFDLGALKELARE
jgi:AAA+ ATPase superfamily predicted ATPase